MKRLTVTRTLDSDYNFSGSIPNVVIALQKLINEYGNTLSISRKYYGYDGGFNLVLTYQTLETDDEYNKRVAYEEAKVLKAEKRAAHKKANDLRQLAALKMKYE